MGFAPFGCTEAALFVQEYTARDALLAYGIFGGLPGHLALLDPSVDLPTNVQEEILDPGTVDNGAVGRLAIQDDAVKDEAGGPCRQADLVPVGVLTAILAS